MTFGFLFMSRPVQQGETVKVTIAYIEEPPFGWKEPGGRATGADIDLADAVLRAIGVTQIEHHQTTFSELLPGVASGRWDMNVAVFVTPERAEVVAFSLPVWAIRDGFLVRKGNPKALYSYTALAKRHDSRLGIIAGQVQHDSAKAAGVRDEQIVVFEHQADAIEAVCSRVIDAYASTAVGNRILADRIGAPLEAIDHEPEVNEVQRPPIGAFSFNKNNRDLIDAVNVQLRLYLGSPEHRRRMAKFGLMHKELDPALVR